MNRFKRMLITKLWMGLSAGATTCWLVVPVLGASGTEYALKDLYALDGAYVWGLGINAHGQVVGYALGGPQFTNCLEHGFVWSNGVVIDFGALPVFAGWSATWARAINSAGQVVGRAEGPRGGAFLYADGQVTIFGDRDAWANAINDRGHVVGRSSNRAFLYSEGRLIDLGTLGGDASEARAINNAGQIVGGARTASGSWRAFLYESGQMRDLGTLGGTSSDAYGINAQGKVVGWAKTASGQRHAFLWSEGQMADLGTLGGDYSIATAINDHDVVVGYSSTADAGPLHAFVWSEGKMTDLNTLIPADCGWVLHRANGVNNAGQIVGTAEDPSGLGTVGPAAFLLTPRPVLSHPAVGAGAFWARVRTAPATCYVLEWTDRLPATNWTAVLEFVGDGTVQTLSQPVTGPQRFYRLRLQ